MDIQAVLGLFITVFAKCVQWTQSLIEATGTEELILSAFLLCVIVALFIVPLRGASLTPAVSDFVAQGTYSKGRKRDYRGRYTKDSLHKRRIGG